MLLIKPHTLLLIFIHGKIITTRSLVSIHHHTRVTEFFLMRTFKIYTFSNFCIYSTTLLTIVPCCTLHPVTYFITRSLYLLLPSPILPTPQAPPWQPLVCFLLFLYLWAWDFFCFWFYVPHISEIIQYFVFSDWLFSLSIMPLKPICGFKRFHSF